MTNINDLKNILKSLQKEHGYIHDEEGNVIEIPKCNYKKDEEMLKLFEWIIDYLEEKELKDSGYYD